MLNKPSNMSFYIIILIIFIIILSTVWLFYNSKNWTETAGNIDYIELEEIHDSPASSMSTNKGFTEYRINLKYTYNVDGNEYTGTRFYPLIPNVFSDRKYANELLEKYSSNNAVKVYYDPNSPSMSCLITSKDMLNINYPLLGFFALVFLTVFITAVYYFNKLVGF